MPGPNRSSLRRRSMRHAEERTRASGGRVGCALRYVEESWRERGQSPFASAVAPGGVRSVVRLLLPAVGPASELVLERDTGAHLAEKPVSRCRATRKRCMDGCATLPRKVDWRWVPRRGAAWRCSDEGNTVLFESSMVLTHTHYTHKKNSRQPGRALGREEGTLERPCIIRVGRDLGV